mgnify:CR=1 FL=1
MSKERTRILVVDDEEIVRESLSGWLAKDDNTTLTISTSVRSGGPSWTRAPS